MTNGSEFDKPGTYQVRVRGMLDEKWTNWFDGFTITPQMDDECLLTGRVTDQAALYGLISKIGSIGLPLLSVHRVLGEEQSSDEVTREENDEFETNNPINVNVAGNTFGKVE
jgi:hypothetical protein